MKPAGNARWALLFAFVAIALLHLFGGGGGSSEGQPRLATRLGGPNGARALFQATQRLGLPAKGDVTPPLEWEQPADAGTVRALLGPTRELAAAEARAVLAWVQSGGDLVLSLDEDLPGRRLRTQLQAARDDGAATEESLDREVARIALGEGRILDLGSPEDLTSARLLGLAKAEHPYVRWLHERLPEKFRPLDPSYPPPNPQRGVDLLQHLLRFADGRPVLFDDSAHGLGARVDPTRRFAAFVRSEPEGHALLALLALVPLWLVVRGARRGPPLPPPAWADSGRSSLEHARALATLWEDSGATRRPRELFASDLSERLGAGREPKDLAPRLLRMAGDSVAARADAQLLGHALGTEHTIDPRRLTEVARARQRFWNRARNS